jgi:lipid A 3-O-deacylase
MARRAVVVCLLVAGSLAPRASRAGEDPGQGPLWGVVSELRLGVLSHDMAFPSPRDPFVPDPFRHRHEPGASVNGEILFASPSFLWVIGSPRPRVGGSVNVQGYTDDAYLDLDWEYRFRVGLFVEGFLGGVVHDGKLLEGNPRWAELGSRFLFHLGLEVGWRLWRHHGLSIYWEHMSNSALAAKNQGMDNMGLRYGYRFGE